MGHTQFWIDQKTEEVKRIKEQIEKTEAEIARMKRVDAGKPKNQQQYDIRIPLEESRLRDLKKVDLYYAQYWLQWWKDSQQFWIMRQKILTSPRGRP
jgi:hypothetical protein